MRKITMLFLASCSAVTATAPTSTPVTANPYTAAIDVACFLFAAPRAQTSAEMLDLKAKCEAVLTPAYAGKVTK